MLCTQPNICLAIGLISRCHNNPGLDVWQAVKRVERYLRGTADLVLCYQGKTSSLRGYSNVNLVSHLDESRSTSG